MKRVDGVTAAQANQLPSSGSIPASTLHFWFGESVEAMTLVERYHYSQRWPSAVQYVLTAHLSGGLFGTKGEAIAAVVFGIPGTRWGENVLELSRMVRIDGVRLPLSALVAAACRKIRRENKWDLLVSFADARLHHGGVYQACGWAYHGLRKPATEGIKIGDLFVPGRTANSRYGTRSADRLRERGIDAELVWDEGKHLYWKALMLSGVAKADRLGLRRIPYPKPTAIGLHQRRISGSGKSLVGGALHQDQESASDGEESRSRGTR